MKKLLAFAAAYFIILFSCTACTTFLLKKNGQLIFGRNYDWVTAAGMVCTNLRGLQKTSMNRENKATISWVSDYGSITFNQYGKEFPNGGMNEKGLVVEMMWLDATKFPDADNRPAMNVLQWIQYQLDKSSTVDDVITTDKMIRIDSKATPVHYLVADAEGNAATIEFLNGKMVVHKGKELAIPVLTNNTYEESIQKTAGAGAGRSFADNSIDRFAKACNMVQQYNVQNINTPIVDYAFSILDKVSQGEWTRWSIVYDITNKKISFKSYGFGNIKTVSFSSFDFSCNSSPKMLNINQNLTGEVSGSFKNFSIAEGRPILEAAVEESKKEVNIPEPAKEALLNYSSQVKCK